MNMLGYFSGSWGHQGEIVRTAEYRCLYQGCSHCGADGLWDRMVQVWANLNLYSPIPQAPMLVGHMSDCTNICVA